MWVVRLLEEIDGDCLRITPTYVGSTQTQMYWAYRQRITPTYVGSTYLVLIGLIGPWDHPHVCGQYDFIKYEIAQILGSPPRMWVVLLNFFAKTSTLRITPTYVGSTNPKYREKQGRQDHPHVCGQYYIMFIYLEANRGSPPRMWVVLQVSHSI